ncbi:MAG: hypothetical protein V4493_03495 [Pseudomonadota bacterium]
MKKSFWRLDWIALLTISLASLFTVIRALIQNIKQQTGRLKTIANAACLFAQQIYSSFYHTDKTSSFIATSILSVSVTLPILALSQLAQGYFHFNGHTGIAACPGDGRNHQVVSIRSLAF